MRFGEGDEDIQPRGKKRMNKKENLYIVIDYINNEQIEQ